MDRQVKKSVGSDGHAGTSASVSPSKEELTLEGLGLRESHSTDLSTTSSDTSATELSPGLATAPVETWCDAFDSRVYEGKVKARDEKAGETKGSKSKLSDSKEEGKDKGGHQLRQIMWKNKVLHIVTQNENGPCPLIAIINVLLLRGTITLPSTQAITADQLIQHVAEVILNNYPKNLDPERLLDYERNINDAITVLPRLLTGLDVNVIFTGVKKFEYTPECIIFDLLNISLYHGWLVDPQDRAAVAAVGTLGYNQLVDMVVVNKSCDVTELVTEALIAEQFLQGTASQLTYHGLCELNETLNPNELAVLFRNNHFSTIYKRKDDLYQLMTDQGYMVEPRMVWEAMVNIEGDAVFVDSNFNVAPFKSATNFLMDPPVVTKEKQIDQDYLLALSLNEEMKGGKEEPEWEETKAIESPKTNSPVLPPPEVMEVDESSEAAEETEPLGSCHGSKTSLPSSSKSPAHQPPPPQTVAPPTTPPAPPTHKKSLCSVQ